MLFGSRIVNCSQEETFGNLLSRLEEDKFSENDFFLFFFFLPATQVYFVIKLARATKYQVGLALVLKNCWFADQSLGILIMIAL